MQRELAATDVHHVQTIVDNFSILGLPKGSLFFKFFLLLPIRLHMKKFILSALVLTSLVSCSSSRPITATSNVIGHDKGEACERNVLFIIPLSTDRGVHKAAKNGSLETISTVDSESFYSFFYNSTCTIVHGHKSSPQVKQTEVLVQESLASEVEQEKSEPQAEPQVEVIPELPPVPTDEEVSE